MPDGEEGPTYAHFSIYHSGFHSGQHRLGPHVQDWAQSRREQTAEFCSSLAKPADYLWRHYILSDYRPIHFPVSAMITSKESNKDAVGSSPENLTASTLSL